MATRKVRPVHFEAYQEGPDSVIPEDCATVFSSWSSGIIKAPLHAEGVVGKELKKKGISCGNSASWEPYCQDAPKKLFGELCLGKRIGTVSGHCQFVLISQPLPLVPRNQGPEKRQKTGETGTSDQLLVSR